MNCKRYFHRIKIFGQKRFGAAKPRAGIRRSKTELEKVVQIVNDAFWLASCCLMAGGLYVLIVAELRDRIEKELKK